MQFPNKHTSSKWKSQLLKYLHSTWVHALGFNLLCVCIYLISTRNFVFSNKLTRDFIHTCLLTVGFAVPIFFTVWKWKWNYRDLGFRFSLSGFFLGIGLYLIPTGIFLGFRIFFSAWQQLTASQVILPLLFACWMAAITDAWFHGFLFLGLLNGTKWWFALLMQNIYWFFYHVAEIQGLAPTLGLWGAIGLSTFLGIMGDLIAWKYRSVLGLMAGHVLFNLIHIIIASSS